jgi:hypothetical protein
VGTNVSEEEHTAPIFRVEVNKVRKLAGYTKVGLKEMSHGW